MPLTLHFNQSVSGSFTGSFSASFTGSLLGTASWANQAVSSSYSLSGSYALSASNAISAAWAPAQAFDTTINRSYSGSFTGSVTGSLLGTASWAQSASFVSSAYVANTAISSSYSLSGSYALSASNAITAAFAFTASFVSHAYNADTANAVDFINVTNKPTLISSSAQVNSGSFTGSFTGSLLGSASYALSSSFALQANNAITASFVSHAYSADGATSASYAVSSSFALSASNALTASFASSVLASSVVGTVSSASFAAKAAVAPINIPLNNTFGADVYITQLPAAVTEWDVGQRTRVDLTGYSLARVVARVNLGAGISASVIPQCSTDENVWGFMSGTMGPSASVVNAGTISSAWVPLSASVTQEVVVRWVTKDGDGAANVKLGHITLQAK